MKTALPFPLSTGATMLALTLAALLPFAPARADDYAVCAGVNHYPNLRPGANLNGCINDAESFAAKMSELGIPKANVTVLKDTTATKAGILAQLSRLKAKMHAGDRFVFYFAGHGTTSGKDAAVFLPSDALDDSERNDMTVSELHSAVDSVGAGVHKTIVLDSCHSGGMISKSWHPAGHALRARFYVRTAKLNQKAHGFRTVKRWQEVDNNGADDLSKVVGDGNGQPATGGGDGSKVCYFTAAQQNQAANETEVGGAEHGLFTYYLVQSLKSKKDVWGNVESDVSSKVVEATDNAQKPAFYPDNELTSVAFGSGKGSASSSNTGGAAASEPATMKDVYCVSIPNPSAMTLKRFPEQGPIAIGSKNYFEVAVHQDGFLVIIARDPAGNLDIMYPRTPRDMSTLAVHSGDTIRLPKEGRSFTPDTVGPDGVQAILFAHEEDAQAMLKPFLPGAAAPAPASGGDGSRSYRSRKARDAKHDWDEEPIPSETAAATTAAPAAPTAPAYVTSEVATMIVPREEAAPE